MSEIFVFLPESVDFTLEGCDSLHAHLHFFVFCRDHVLFCFDQDGSGWFLMGKPRLGLSQNRDLRLANVIEFFEQSVEINL